jgi:succinyl-CoA synthetase beta subunit
MDIEKVAHDTPDRIVTLSIDPASGYSAFHGRRSPPPSSSKRDQIDQCVKLVGQLYQAPSSTRTWRCSRSTRWW